MEKIIALIMTIIVSTMIMDANAQSRRNKIMLEVKSESTKLTDAKGWQKNEKTGKWIENKNVIDGKKTKSYWISHISQNFKWMQFFAITYNGLGYRVFLYERLGGKYKYPNIREDWEADKRTYFFVLATEQYERIKKEIDIKSGKTIKISSKMAGFISDRYNILGGEHLYNKENLLAKITITIEESSYSESCFVLNAQIADGIDVLRFRLPESCYSAEKYIETKYFEVKLSEFKAILTE